MTTPVGRFARPRRALVVSAIAVAVGLAGATLPATSASAAATPAKPSGVRVVAVGDSGFTVKLRTSARAKKYRVWASTTKSRLALSTIRRTSKSKASRKPRVTISGLRYSSAPYYFRVQAIGRSKTRFSGVYRTALRTAAPTGLAVSSSRPGGLSLSWGGRSAARFQVQQATDARMRTGLRTWTTRSVAKTFAPYGLRKGTVYYFRVRATNGTSTSGWSAVRSARAQSAGLPVRVVSYNVMQASRDGQRFSSGATIARWSQRGPAVVRNIRSTGATVVALQEASSFVPGRGRMRQADWIREQLGGSWKVARTEVPPTEARYFRTGRYVLYRSDVYDVVRGNHWTLAGGSNPTFAAWAQLRHKRTGASFVAVSTHLVPKPGASLDRRRRAETVALLGQGNRVGSAYGVPVFYAGDFNSAPDVKHPLDGPGVAFAASRVARADHAATSLSSTSRFNSANQGLSRIPAKGVHVDGIWAPRGVGVSRWWMVVPSGGRFTGVIPSDHNPVVADLVLPY